ncbi:hypothetical protein [Nostoc sp.]|nr:hypothetical protein [Nostoc sp.]
MGWFISRSDACGGLRLRNTKSSTGGCDRSNFGKNVFDGHSSKVD